MWILQQTTVLAAVHTTLNSSIAPVTEVSTTIDCGDSEDCSDLRVPIID